MPPTDVLNRLVAWMVAHPELSVTLLTALLGSGEAVRRYHRTGDIPLRTLPWRAIRRLAYALRRRIFSVGKPSAQFRADLELTLDELTTLVATQGYEPAWPFSYYYHGEDLNARRYFYAPDQEFPHRQLHIRAWDAGDGVEVHAHEEPSALHHPKAHLQGTDMQGATDWVVDRADSNPSALDPRGFQ